MLFLFRKIRKSLMKENKFSSYLVYAIGEIFLVVVGILIAVNINNWNGDRKSRELEIQYLQNIKIDLGKDLEKLENLSAFRTEKKEIAQRLIANINSNGIDDLDLFIQDVNTMLAERKFMPNNTTFSELSSSGNLNIISNDTIKLLMLDLTNDYAQNAEGIAHETFDYREYISKPTATYFDLNKYKSIYSGLQSADELGVHKEDFEPLLKSEQYKNGLHIITIMSDYFIVSYEETRRKSSRIIELIDQEME